MPHDHEWLSRIKAVGREYVVMQHAADRFQEQAESDPTILREHIRLREIVNASVKLEATYIIRLFAEFETGASQFWATLRSTNPMTAGLLDGLASRCRIPTTQLENAHAVREYRNSLVREREETMEAVPISQARSSLCHFFSLLPPEW